MRKVCLLPQCSKKIRSTYCNNICSGLEYREPERHSVATTASIVVSMLVVLAVALVALVFYYRRKYMKERDPVIPTITFVIFPILNFFSNL